MHNPLLDFCVTQLAQLDSSSEFHKLHCVGSTIVDNVVDIFGFGVRD